MGEDEYSLSVSCVMSDYISYRVHREGYSWQTSPTRNCPDSEVLRSMRELCTEFENKYALHFKDILSDCSEFELTSDAYNCVLEQILEDGLHWGRVVAIFTYAGAMAVYCAKHNRENKINVIREWTCSFVTQHVENWINQNGGWKGLVEFYNKGARKQREEKNGWGSYLLGGALGAMALGALIVNRA